MTRIVLLADESQTIRALFRLTLAGQPLTPLTAGSGAEALQIVRSRHPDVVLADVLLGDIDGYQLCRLIREHAPAVPVVLLAAHHVPYDEALAREVGARGLLRKPFERRALLQLVQSEQPTATPSTMNYAREAAPDFAPDDIAPLRRAAPLSPPLTAAPKVAAPAVSESAAPLRTADLEAMLERRLPEWFESTARPQLDALLKTFVEQAMPQALARALEPRVDAALLRPLVEPLVWKIVPALAEQMVKEEIERLSVELEEDGGPAPRPTPDQR